MSVYSRTLKPTSKLVMRRSNRMVVMRAIPASSRTRFALTVCFELIDRLLLEKVIDVSHAAQADLADKVVSCVKRLVPLANHVARARAEIDADGTNLRFRIAGWDISLIHWVVHAIHEVVGELHIFQGFTNGVTRVEIHAANQAHVRGVGDVV